jgi:general secretion pathway protein A
VYRQFYGFERTPFALTPDPAFLYKSRQHAMALTLLEYSLESRAVFGLLTGEVGTGKTTLLRHLLGVMGTELTVGLISNTHASFESIHPWIVSAFGITPESSTEISVYNAIVSFLNKQRAIGRRTLLIIDEAQNLSPALLEELRLLSNVNESGELILQTFLIGQPELRDTLKRPDLRQLAQRISADYHLRPFSAEETTQYIRHRLSAAGGSPDRMDEAAIRRVFEHSGGIPRLINRICDMAFVYGYAMQQPIIDVAVIEEIIVDRQSVGALPFPTQVNNDYSGTPK